MTRSRSALAAVVAAVALLAGCGGGDASQSEVQDEVADLLAEDGYLGQDLSASQVAGAAACVSAGLFDPERFTKDERNEVSSAVDGEAPSGELVDRFTDLVGGCVDDEVAGEPQGPSLEDEDEGEQQTNDDEDSTTTTG